MGNASEKRYEAVAIGCSTGGFETVQQILAPLPEDFPMVVVVVLHIREGGGSFLIQRLSDICTLRVKEASQLEVASRGTIYVALPGFHLYIDKDRVFSLSLDEKVNYARPSIDVFFESAARIFKDRLIGVLLTGNGSDGTIGMVKIKEQTGLTLVQTPETAVAREMPKNAIKAGAADHILPPEEIANFLLILNRQGTRGQP